jgi:hypothetical protein
VGASGIKVNSQGTEIARIFEHGEALAYVRFGMRKLLKLSTADPKIVELRFNFQIGTVISEHSMGRLQKNIRAELRLLVNNVDDNNELRKIA